MAAPLQTPRSAWLDAGLGALAAGGPDAVRVESLAKLLGVSKGGFYWHFTGREAFVEAMLDAWERQVVDQVIDRVEAGGGDARSRLAQLFDLAATTPGLPEAELAVRDWGRREPAVRERIRGVDNRRTAYLRTLFKELFSDAAEVEARCLLVMTLFVGNSFVATDHGRRRRGTVVARALQILEGPPAEG